jgi:TusE/DsrC/DsvC family sulfur relay protein
MAGKPPGTGRQVDSDGFLLDFELWDEDFAIETANRCGITSGLTENHWRVIYWIRRHVEEFGACPLADRTCIANGLELKDLRELFPSGYLRGACRIAGVTYAQGVRGPLALPGWARRLRTADVSERPKTASTFAGKTYTVDAHGFLVHHEEWDEEFAVSKAGEMKMPELSARHWGVIWYLRRKFDETMFVPTIYETCEELAMTFEELGELFPDGYHGGAVKIAGLRAIISAVTSRQS